MKQTVFILSLILLLAVFCGCQSPAYPYAGSEDTPASETAAEDLIAAEAPASETAAAPAYLGKSVEFDPAGDASELIDRLIAEGKVCQLVNDFSFADMAFTRKAIYAYDSFPCLTGDEPTEGASRADGSALYVDVNTSPDMSGLDPKLITDPVIIGAFDETISALEFTDDVPEAYAGTPSDYIFGHENACYANIDADGNETVYVFYCSGELIGRGSREGITAVSTAPIPEAVRCFFFGVLTEYAGAENEWLLSIEKDIDSDRIDVEIGGETLQLRGEEAVGFTDLFREDPSSFYAGFACKTRINCENEDHGKALLTFKFANDNPDITSYKGDYTFYEDGHIIAEAWVEGRSSWLCRDMTVYGLDIRRQMVSVNTFDTQTVLDYLENVGK